MRRWAANVGRVVMVLPLVVLTMGIGMSFWVRPVGVWSNLRSGDLPRFAEEDAWAVGLERGRMVVERHPADPARVTAERENVQIQKAMSLEARLRSALLAKRGPFEPMRFGENGRPEYDLLERGNQAEVRRASMSGVGVLPRVGAMRVVPEVEEVVAWRWVGRVEGLARESVGEWVRRPGEKLVWARQVLATGRERVAVGMWGPWVVSVVMAVPLVREVGRWRRRRRGLCEGCGYDLRGNASGRCSECGREAGEGSES